MELCIGTVEFGMQYGIRYSGRPDAETAEAMLEYARAHGIVSIDTSSAYGEAERIIGGFLHKQPRKEIHIYTQLRPDILYSIPPKNYYNTIRQNLRESLQSLHVEYVDGCLFHNAEYVDNAAAMQALAQLKRDGLAKRTGMSTYTPAEFEKAIRIPSVDILQIPYNLLDTRLDGLLKKVRPNVEIHARNVFLQGLLLTDTDEVPQPLWDAKQYLLRIDAFCEYYGVTRMQAVLNFIKTQPRIDKLVFGVQNMAQLEQVEQAFHVEVSPVALRELAEEFAVVGEKIIMPSLWNVEYK